MKRSRFEFIVGPNLKKAPAIREYTARFQRYIAPVLDSIRQDATTKA
jgi:hypothetical protein